MAPMIGPVVAISPHLDDAVLSVGATLGTLAQRGVSVHIVTVFAGDAPEVLSEVAKRHHVRCGLGSDAVLRRRSEDIAACAELGVMPHHLRLLDVVYRSDDLGRPVCGSDDELFGDIGDQSTMSAVRNSVWGLLNQLRPTVVLVPMAVGGHVDHVVTRAAVESRLKGNGVALGLWLDVPYALGPGVPTASGEVSTIACTDLKLAAVSHYRSQLPMLFGSYDQLARLRQWQEQIYWPNNAEICALIDTCIRSSP